MLDTRFPRPLGDIGHPRTFPFAVRRRIVHGASPQRVVRENDPALLQAFVEAGLALVAEGAQALSTSCGFLACWQGPLQAALPVPVWTSALLHLAPLQAAGRRCGVITIDAASLTARHFAGVGADPATPVEGIAPGSALQRSLLEDLPTLDEDDARAQVVAAGQRLLRRCPEVQELVLECTNLPPYAAALAEATGRPVHDIVGLITARLQGMRGPGGPEIAQPQP